MGNKKMMDDGEFWMSFRDFVNNFTDVYVCRLFKTVSEGGKWYRYKARGRWSVADGTAVGSTNNQGAENNPQYYIHPSKRCNLFISLTQAESEPELHPIGFYLLRKKGRRCRCRYSGETLATAKYTVIREVRGIGHRFDVGCSALRVVWERWRVHACVLFLDVVAAHVAPRGCWHQVTAEALVEKEKHPFTLFPSTYAPGQEVDYLITVYSTAPLLGVESNHRLRRIPSSVPAK